EEQEQKRPHPRSIQRFRYATLALQLGHVPLPDDRLFWGEINPLDKYWQAGFYAVFCRSCERRIDNPEAHYRSRINDYRLKNAGAAAPR
ncbi:MAG TPA: hypothetical protein VMT08_14825, partial [Bradyrhizobium sp.]|nr:hypothetical protein [Bradyrhizobium sp.]